MDENQRWRRMHVAHDQGHGIFLAPAWLSKFESAQICPWNPKVRNLPHRVGKSTNEICLA
jgi:hypothetical protein